MIAEKTLDKEKYQLINAYEGFIADIAKKLL